MRTDAGKGTPKHIILASGSPRRRELLAQIGIPCTVEPADLDESVLPGETPEAFAERVALDKALVVAGRGRTGIIIAADTIVVIDGTILGKPENEDDAVRMLSVLSGRDHRVITGLAVMDAGTGERRTRSVATRVWFRHIRSDDIRSYVATGEPLDKAGAYGIQGKGAVLVERIDGCYFNVVGLPLAALIEMLEPFYVSPWNTDDRTV